MTADSISTTVDTVPGSPVVPRSGRARHRKTRQTLGGPVALSWGVVVLGSLLRIRQFLFNRSIWNDEAEFAIAVLNRGYIALAHPDPLDTAPLGFNWIEKLATELFGSSERAFRTVPLLCALVGLVAFRFLANRVLPAWPSLVALVIFSLSPSLIYYSAETKPYAFDVTAVILLFLLFLRLDGTEVSWRQAFGWGLALAVLDWFSFTALFAACAASVLLVVGARDRETRIRVVAGSAVWVVSLVAEYLITFRPLHESSILVNDWVGGYPPKSLGIVNGVHWLWSTTLSLIADPLNLDYGVLALLLILFGLVLLVRRFPAAGLFCVSVIVLTALSGLARAYPVTGRLDLFLVPIVSLSLGSVLTVPIHGISRWIVAGLTLLVCVSLLSQTVAAAVYPYTKNEGREALTYALAHEGRDGAVLVEASGTNVYAYYHQTTGLTATAEIWLFPGDKVCDPYLQTEWLKPYRSFWIVFIGAPGTPAVLDSFLRALKGTIKDTRVVTFPGAWAVHARLSNFYGQPVPEPTGRQYVCINKYILPKAP